MTREQAIRKREKLAAKLSPAIGVLRGSLLQRTIRHSSRSLEAISELNQFLLRLDREESKGKELKP